MGSGGGSSTGGDNGEGADGPKRKGGSWVRVGGALTGSSKEEKADKVRLRSLGAFFEA